MFKRFLIVYLAALAINGAILMAYVPLFGYVESGSGLAPLLNGMADLLDYQLGGLLLIAGAWIAYRIGRWVVKGGEPKRPEI